MTSMLRKGAVAVAAFAVVGLAAGPATAATAGGSATANAATASGTGIFDPVAKLLSTGSCLSTFTGVGPEAKTGNCTPSIHTSPADVVVQYATSNVATSGAATSSAESKVAGVQVVKLTQQLNLTNLVTDLTNTPVANSGLGAILNPLLQAVVGPNGLLGGTLQTVTQTLDSVLDPILGTLDQTLPLSIKIGAVTAKCSANGTTATGSSEIAGIDVVVDLSALGLGSVNVPIHLATTANADLIADVGQLVTALLNGLKSTLETSIGGALSPLAGLVQTLNDIASNLLETLRPTLLTSLSDLLKPIISGTLNVTPQIAKGTKQPFTSKGEIDITALKLTVLGNNTLNLAHVHCGDNKNATATVPNTPAKVPTLIESGNGGGMGTAGLVAALMLAGTAIGVAGHRKLFS